MTLLTILLQTPIDNPDKFNGYLILGYAVMWLIGIAYLLYLYNKQRNIRADIKMLHTLLENDSET